MLFVNFLTESKQRGMWRQNRIMTPDDKRPELTSGLSQKSYSVVSRPVKYLLFIHLSVSEFCLRLPPQL